MIPRILNKFSQIGLEDVRVEFKKEIEILSSLTDKRPLVYYMGWTGHQNLGDEVLYEAHKTLFPNLRFIPFRKLSPASSLIRLVRRKGFAAGFLGGGTLINQSPAWIDYIKRVQAYGLPVYCFGTGVTEDKFKFDFEKTNLKQWTPVLDTMPFVGIRGPRSMELLESVSFRKAKQIGDTALALAPAKMFAKKRNKVIGLNYGISRKTLMWGDNKNYTKQITAIIKGLIEQGYEIRLLPVWPDDIESNTSLLKYAGSKRCSMRIAYDNLNDYNKELNECSFFIGQKLHSTIFACMQRIPSIMIEYQPKCMDFMRSINLEDYVIKTSECTPDKIIEMIDLLSGNYDRIRETIDKQIIRYQEIQRGYAEDIEKQLIESVKNQ